MPFTVVRNDITKMAVDAIVNAANVELAMGGGVCGAIFNMAGAGELQAACDRFAPIKTGDAVVTPGFKLPAKYIIHAAGPVYFDGKSGEEEQLRSAYTNSLKLAVENRCASIAFPLISSGIYGYPKVEAFRVASDAIRAFIQENDIDVKLVLFDKASFVVGSGLLGEVKIFIDQHYVEEHHAPRRELLDIERRSLRKRQAAHVDMLRAAPLEPQQAAPFDVQSLSETAGGVYQPSETLDELVGKLDEPFSETLLRLIDQSGMSDAEVYKRANIDRRLFSKIRSNRQYAPSKLTVLAFAIALELSLEQTGDLLNRAGFALSRSRKFDVIIEFFITRKKYDVFEINEVLFSYDQALLGGN